MNEKVARIGNWVLFVITIPYGVIIGWTFTLLFTIFFCAHKLKINNYGILTAQWRPWAAKIWLYTTTFGRSIIFHPDSLNSTSMEHKRAVKNHELVHIRQLEDNMLISFLIGLIISLITFNWIFGLIIWASGGIWQVGNFLTALLRGGHVYRDAEHERSAYAQTDETSTNCSWLDNHLKNPRTW
jgi:hypothetical protein